MFDWSIERIFGVCAAERSAWHSVCYTATDESGIRREKGAPLPRIRHRLSAAFEVPLHILEVA